MEQILIEHLMMVAKELMEEANEKQEWGSFGNSWGKSEIKNKLEFWADILMAISINL